MRLLMYGLNFWPELTGVGKYSGEMALWLAEKGHAVDVVTAPPYYPSWQVSGGYSAARYQRQAWGQAGKVQITRCPLWVPSTVSTLRRLLHLASFALASLPALWMALRRRPDALMVVVPTLLGVPGALMLARLWRVPTWVHVQDFEIDAMFHLGMGVGGGPMRRLAARVESSLLRGFDRASSIAPSMIARLVSKGVPAEHCVEFPNWVDLSAIYPLPGPSPFRAEWDLSDDDVVVLYAGNMGEKQGLDMVVDAARALVDQPNIHFVLAGAGSARARLEHEATGLANVRWLPLQPMDRLNALLNAADIHVLPQRADAADLVMPSKLTGMLASGRATVGTAALGTQLGQVLELAGQRVNPGDLASLVRVLRQLSLDSSARAALGLRARSYAEQHLGLDSIMGRFEQQMQTLIDQQVIGRRL